MSDYHTTVLLNEAIDWLSITKGGVYVDCTFGGGGHTVEILNRGGNVLAIDADEDAHKNILHKKIGEDSGSLVLKKGNFKDIKKIVEDCGISRVDGVLFDLGVSGHQLDDPSRGFSFREDGPLDMRMSKDLLVKAEDLVNGLSEKELEMIFLKYGEENLQKKLQKKLLNIEKEI